MATFVRIDRVRQELLSRDVALPKVEAALRAASKRQRKSRAKQADEGPHIGSMAEGGEPDGEREGGC